ncbi:MAG: nicotinate phosphoribosyltransferase [Parcubacteria group bacterium RIFCSPLOWO2_01_FULL_48_18]|nr:MAG: nicotinate phosphoribosyltransferase [Parcubacteria group bacterium RIFCSPLOWO2_01_FULL_48_18]OHB22587.1 MAG: nicotinate phosphoribosyltransferase [Parcubacteria group bacterium RIFCSPHIGHO2_02_FULL_48_10b]
MPIIASLLDLDIYKLYMQQLQFHRFLSVPVTFAFTNRTKRIALPNFIRIEELRDELDHAQTLRAKEEEIAFLRESTHIPRGRFKEDYLAFFKNYRLPGYNLERYNNTFILETEGPWPQVTLWETIQLRILTALYNKGVRQKEGYDPDEFYAEGERIIREKGRRLRQYPGITIVDFATRRSDSPWWHRREVEILLDELGKQLIGTSNVLFAMELGLKPVGTMAHELAMGFSGIFHSSDEEIRNSHDRVFQCWEQEYSTDLWIALTDTYHSDYFFTHNFTEERARAWRGTRQDSGNPIVYGEKQIAAYNRYGIDGSEKVCVFSDGLDPEKIIDIHTHFGGIKDKIARRRLLDTYGWGTNAANDFGLFSAIYPPPSMVVKLVKSCGYGTVKLSDNLAKAIGDPEHVERFKQIFGYTGSRYEECTY